MIETEKTGILCYAPSSWSRRRMGAHQIMSRLASYAPVVWMNPARDLRTSLRSGNNGAVPCEVGGLTTYDHGTLLSHVWRPGFVGDLTFALRARRGVGMLREQGCTRIIAYLFRARFARALELDLFDGYVYHMLDEYTFSESDRPIPDVERRVIREADTVIVHSQGLEEKKGHINPNTLRIPNGVDYDRFARPVEEPVDLAAVPRPRIGYTGWLKRQLDWRLVERLVGRHPEWHFVFVGGMSPHAEIRPVVERLSAAANVRFLGPKTTDELARYPQHFDCCVMPYKRNAYTNLIYPLKLHEYLAGGRPVVGSRIRSLESYRGLIGVAEGPEEWEAEIRRALHPAASTPERVAARRSMARRHDWHRLVRRIAVALALVEEPAAIAAIV